MENSESYIASANILEKGNINGPIKYSLYNKIIAQNQENGLMVLDNQASTYVSASTGIDFYVAPSTTNGQGVYVRNGTESDTYPVYYYRGAVTNNNVVFANYCWKIVRTTETGGIKLIYNGKPTNGACNNTGTASQLSSTSQFNTSYGYNAYVGYMYGTPNSSTYAAEHANRNNSTIKTAIDTWYAANMASYTDKLEDTVWCNDRSFASSNTGTGISRSATYYGATGRVYNSNPAPSLECINQNDRFTVNETMEGRVNGNGALTYPVALLTVDELTLAGQGYNGYSTTNYLHTGQVWWSLSPLYFSGDYALEFGVHASGPLYGITLAYSYGVRPAVSLLLGTEISKNGDGSVNSPFVVE